MLHYLYSKEARNAKEGIEKLQRLRRLKSLHLGADPGLADPLLKTARARESSTCSAAHAFLPEMRVDMCVLGFQL